MQRQDLPSNDMKYTTVCGALFWFSEGDFMLDLIRNFNADFDAIFDEVMQTPNKEDIRGSRSALPTDVLFYLNEVQRLALHSLENFGWQLAFIRRPLFVPPIVVVKNSEQSKFAVLEEDGSVNLSPSAKWRH